MADLNSFAIAVSELDQERRRLTLERQREREIRQREQELFELEKRERDLRIRDLEAKDKLRTQSETNLRGLLGAWSEVVETGELPEEEAVSKVEEVTDKSGRKWTNLVVRGGKVAKVKAAEERFQVALESASATPGAIETMFQVIQGVSNIRNLKEETKLKHGLMRAQIAKYMSEITGTGRDLEAVGKQLTINDQAYRIMNRDLLPESEETISKRWDDRIKATTQTAGAISSNVGQLVSSLSMTLFRPDEVVGVTSASQKAQDTIKSSKGVLQPTDYLALAQEISAAGNFADNAARLVKPGSEQDKQLLLLRKRLGEYDEQARVLASQFAERESELLAVQKKREYGTLVFHSLVTNQNRPPELAASETVSLVNRLFRSAAAIENNVSKMEIYQKATGPAATQDDVVAAHQLINQYVAQYGVTKLSQRGIDGEEDTARLRSLLIDNLKQKRALRFQVSK